MTRRDMVVDAVAVPVIAVLVVVALWVAETGGPWGRHPSLPPASDVQDRTVLIPPLVLEQTSSTVTTTTPTTVAVKEKQVPVASDWTWDDMGDCESGDWDRDGHPIPGTARWDDQSAGYEGGLHFLNSTWLRAGGGRFAVHAYDATREQQIEVAQDWLNRTSLAQWPVCSYKIGAR